MLSIWGHNKNIVTTISSLSRANCSDFDIADAITDVITQSQPSDSCNSSDSLHSRTQTHCTRDVGSCTSLTLHNINTLGSPVCLSLHRPSDRPTDWHVSLRTRMELLIYCSNWNPRLSPVHLNKSHFSMSTGCGGVNEVVAVCQIDDFNWHRANRQDSAIRIIFDKYNYERYNVSNFHQAFVSRFTHTPRTIVD